MKIQKWKDYHVFEEVPDIGQSTISVRWVCTEKNIDNQIITKARLVARGFEEQNKFRKDSPTCSKENMRLAFVNSVTNHWRINSLDIQRAFLQGDHITREIYLKPPKEANTECLWKLKKCIYGLCDASRSWYLKLEQELSNLGMSKCKLDNALFYWYHSNQLHGIMTVHVDDIYWAGSEIFQEMVIIKLKNVFEISREKQDSFIYLGLRVNHFFDKITIDQDAYIQNIKEIEINRERKIDKDSAINFDEKQQLRSTIGQLNWVSTQTRPDITFDTCEVSVRLKDATIRDIIKVNKIIRKLKAEKVSLKFSDMGNLTPIKLVSFSDVSFCNPSEQSSQGGYIIFFRNIHCKSVPIAWQSKKIRRVVKSTMAAECLSLLEAAETCYLLKSILVDTLKCKQSEITIECYIDNKSLKEAIYSTKSHTDKRLKIDLAVIKDMVLHQEIDAVIWIAAENQLADCLTKSGSSTANLLNALNTGDIEIRA